MPLSAASSLARERLIATAAELMASRGLRSVTARALAEVSGQSASAVNYHFSGREGLLTATFESAAEAVELWRAGWLGTLEAQPPPEAFPGWFLALILDRVQGGPTVLVLRELRHSAARSDAHRAVARRDSAAADAFWRRAVQAFDLPPEAAGACADFAESILGIHGGPPDHPDQSAWLIETLRRFALRLAGERSRTLGWDGWRQFARRRSGRDPTHNAPLPPTAVRIAAAAAEVLGRGGMEALTHRAVAAEVGLSLAAVSGHFPSRVSLVRGAFDSLIASIQSVRSDAVPDLDGSQPIASAAVEMAEALFDPEGTPPPGLLALDELMSAAIRDPELRRDAEDLRASRGENSASLLARLRHGAEATDGLDAHLVSILTTGAMRSAYAQEPADRRVWLARRLETTLTALLGAGA